MGFPPVDPTIGYHPNLSKLLRQPTSGSEATIMESLGEKQEKRCLTEFSGVWAYTLEYGPPDRIN